MQRHLFFSTILTDVVIRGHYEDVSFKTFLPTRMGKVMFSQVSVCRSYGYSCTVRPCYCAVGTYPIEMLSVFFLLLIKKNAYSFLEAGLNGKQKMKMSIVICNLSTSHKESSS